MAEGFSVTRDGTQISRVRRDWAQQRNAPINVNPVEGECGQGVGIWQILKFFDQIPQGGKRKLNQKCQKSPHPRGKNLDKQYYNTV